MSRFAMRVRRGVHRSVVPTGWPDASNTGYSGTLTSYVITNTSVTSDLTLDHKHITGDGLQVFAGAKLTLTNCKVDCTIDCDYADQPITITDCELNGSTSTMACISASNLNIQRCNIYGGQHGIYMGNNCYIKDNYIHDQSAPEGVSTHNNPIICSGAMHNQVIHNSLSSWIPLNAAGGGPTSNFSLLGDFGQIDDILVNNNLFMPSTGSYGAYFGHLPGKPFPVATNIVVTNNVFQRRGDNNMTGEYGTVTAFQTSATGNIWTNNTYFDDGSPVAPVD